jgi:hypothetical protein
MQTDTGRQEGNILVSHFFHGLFYFISIMRQFYGASVWSGGGVVLADRSINTERDQSRKFDLDLQRHNF